MRGPNRGSNNTTFLSVGNALGVRMEDGSHKTTLPERSLPGHLTLRRRHLLHPVRVRSSRPLPLRFPIAKHHVAFCSTGTGRSKRINRTGAVRGMKRLGCEPGYVPTVTLKGGPLGVYDICRAPVPAGKGCGVWCGGMWGFLCQDGGNRGRSCRDVGWDFFLSRRTASYGVAPHNASAGT